MFMVAHLEIEPLPLVALAVRHPFPFDATVSIIAAGQHDDLLPFDENHPIRIEVERTDAVCLHQLSILESLYHQNFLLEKELLAVHHDRIDPTKGFLVLGKRIGPKEHKKQKSHRWPHICRKDRPRYHGMNLHKETYVHAVACTIFLVLLVTAAMAQTVGVNIRFDVNKGKHNDSKVTIMRDGKEVKAITPAKTRLSEVLDYGSDYILTFEKPGYITKRIAISTRNVPKESQEDDLGFDFAVEIFQQYDGLNTVVFNQPVARYYYDPKEDAFTYDTDYTKSIRAALTAFEQEYTEQEKSQSGKGAEAKAKAEEAARMQAEARAADEQRKVEEARAKAAEEKRIEELKAEERKQQQLAEETRAKAAAEEAKRKAEADRQEREARAAREREEQERRAAEMRMAEEKQRELSARMAEEQRAAAMRGDEEARIAAAMKAEQEARAAARMKTEEDERNTAAAKAEEEARRTSALKAEEEARSRAEKQRAAEEAQRASAAQMEEEAKRNAARQKAEREARKLAEAELAADEQRKREALAKAEEERRQQIAREKAMLAKAQSVTPPAKAELEVKPLAPAGPGAILSKDRRTYREGKKEVTEVTITHERATLLYKKVQHDWGGVYFFVNENSITKLEFDSRTGE